MTDTLNTMTDTARREDDAAEIAAMVAEMYDAWARGDAEGFVADYLEDATAIVPGSLRDSRAMIRESMTASFAGPLKGSSTVDEQISLRFAGEDVAIMVARSGILFAGETTVPADRFVHATWVFERHDGRWMVAAYHNCAAVAA